MSLSMFYLLWHQGETFVIDLEPHRLDGQFAYKLDQSFDLSARLHRLSELEETLPPQAQVTTVSIEIASWACASGGAIIKPTRFGLITKPLPKRKQPHEDDDDVADDVQGDVCDEDDDQLVVGTEL